MRLADRSLRRTNPLLDTVAAAIKEDLMRVKDALDIHLRSRARKD